MKRLRVRYRLAQRWLRNNYSADEKTRDVALTASIQRIFWTAPLMAVGNFLVALTFMFQNKPTSDPALLWNELIITTNLSVSMISLMIWGIAWKIKRGKASEQSRKVLLYAVVAYVLAVGLIISLVDSLVMTSITPFLLCVTIVATFYYLPPKNSLLVFAVSFVVFALLFGLFSNWPAQILKSTLVNGLIVCFMGLALSFVSWQHFCRTTVQQRIIVEQQEALKQMAYHDPLTNLPNRRFLDELVRREVASVRRGQIQSCLVVCDIDRFKKINDTYGHPGGDELLQKFAQLLQTNLPEDHTLVRLGGEEFVLLARNTAVEQCASSMEHLRKLVEEHEFSIDGASVHITASFGVAALQGTEGVRDYYVRADQALYQAKKSGRNKVRVFRPTEYSAQSG